jgi:hypothetical protein
MISLSDKSFACATATKQAMAVGPAPTKDMLYISF